jgi:methylenetetrahydrofolate dehydrogenase (NADP+) / methenyltetrahydrofolate cyclohydrolase
MAELLKGKPIAKSLEAEIIQKVTDFRHRGTTVKMVTILVDGDKASSVYATQKRKIAERLGIENELRRFPDHISESSLIRYIQTLNEDKSVHGIMLELPLPKHIATDSVISAIHPLKDVDGLTQDNRMANLTGTPGIYPATPQACVRLLEQNGYSLYGKHVVLVGCGKTVGMPLLHLLIRKGATVTACHAGTKDLRAHVREADILFTAVGKADLITKDMVHRDLIVIDAGIHQTPAKEIVGDTSKEAAELVAAISPTPGGVGVITTMQLFTNLISAVELQLANRQLVTV